MAGPQRPVRPDPGMNHGRGRPLAAVATVCVLLLSVPAFAQGFSWPWSEPERKPVPREPVYRPAPGTAPGPGQSPGAVPPPGVGGYPTARSNICLQLEQRLVQESQKGTQSRELLPKLETDLRAAQRTVQQTERDLDRSDCYEYFLFSKTLRRTRQCVEIATQSDAAKRRVAELDAQRQEIVSASGRSFQDDIIRELARNNCGSNYAQEARKREGSFWQDEEGGGPGGIGGQFGALPYATYRTICVRLCDGYYFPISFSTLPNHFQRDAEMCQSKCAAPVELYYHQNPGSAVEQAVGARTQEPYTKLKSAFRYRKEYVAGCSCKQAEYTPIPGTPGAPQGAPQGTSPPPPDRRAEPPQSRPPGPATAAVPNPSAGRAPN